MNINNRFRNAPDRRARQSRGFTLIELLVVIAIIALLAAILFPVFSQVREKSRQTACLSNLKQIGTAELMYMQDYDDLLLTAFGTGATPDDQIKTSWVVAIQPYLKSGGQSTTVASANANGVQGVMACPSFLLKNLQDAASRSDCDGSLANSYLANPVAIIANYSLAFSWYGGDGLTQATFYYNWPGNSRSLAALSLSKVINPARTANIGDGITYIDSTYNNLQINFGCEAAYSHQHSGGNFVFLDGHAKFVEGNIQRYVSQENGQWIETYLTYDR